MVYGPGEDTWLAVEVVSRCVEGGGVCVDVGSGRGYLSDALSTRCRHVVAVDINEHACRESSRHDVVCCDAARCVKRADVVVSNPPYLPPEEPCTDWEALAIYDCGVLPAVLRVVAVLRPRIVVLVVSSMGRRDFVVEAMEALGYREELRAIVHMFFEDIEAVCWRSKYLYPRDQEDRAGD